MTARALAGRRHGRRSVLVVLRLLGQALEFLGWVLLARQLPGDALGELTIAFLACRYGGLLADWGARYSGVRHVAAGLPITSLLGLVRRRERLACACGVLFVATVSVTGHLLLLPLLGVLLQQGANRDWISLGQHRMAAASVPAVVQGAILLSLTIALPPTTASAAAALCAGYSTSLVLSLALNRLPALRHPQVNAGLGGWPVTAVLADQSVATVDTFLLALLTTPEIAGIYAAVYRLPNAWLAVVGLISASNLPGVASALSEGRTSLAVVRHQVLRSGLVTGSVALLAAPAAAVVVPAVFGPGYGRASAAAGVLVAACAVITVTAALLPAYMVVTSDARYARAQLTAAAVNLGANLALIPVLGMLGAALATLLAQVLLLGLVWVGLGDPSRRSLACGVGHVARTLRAALLAVCGVVPYLTLLAIPLVLGGVAAVTPQHQGLAMMLAVALVLLAVPGLRSALCRREALPLFLTAPAAVSVYPALAVPVTTVVLAAVLLLDRQRLSLSPRDGLGLALAGAALVLPLAAGLVLQASPVYLAGDALQFTAFYLAVAAARTQQIGLLSRRSLWGLWAAVVAVTVANALGRVDFLAAEGSDIQRNINFLAPVLLLWALTDLLWQGVTRRSVFWVASSGLLVLVGFTRGMWAGAAAGVLTVLAVYLTGGDARLAKVKRLTATAALLVAASGTLAAAAPELTSIATQKVSTLFDRGTDYTYQQRAFESAAALDQLHHPLLGQGWGATFVVPDGGNMAPGEVHYVHNQYVAQLLRTGWAGCALTAASVLVLLRVRRGGPGSAAAAATLAYVLVTGWTSPSLFTYPTNILAGLALGAAPLIDERWRALGRVQKVPEPRHAAPLAAVARSVRVRSAAAVPTPRPGESLCRQERAAREARTEPTVRS